MRCVWTGIGPYLDDSVTVTGVFSTGTGYLWKTGDRDICCFIQLLLTLLCAI